MTSGLFSTLAAAGILAVGASAAAGTISSNSLPPVAVAAAAASEASGNLCRVEIARSGAPGSSEIVRQALPGGECVCYMTTGPTGNNGDAESIVDALLRDRQCTNAPLVDAPPPQFAPLVAAALGGGAIAGGVGAAALGGLAAGLGSDSNG